MRSNFKGDVFVYNDTYNKDNEYEKLLFQRVKKAMLKMCNEHSDIIEYQLFKEKLESAMSFDELAEK